MIKEKFSTFLEYSLSQKEVSLIVAKHENELSHFERWLEDKGFRRAAHAFDLLDNLEDHKKLYVILKTENGKDSYDFAAQFPTGQIELFDKKTMKKMLKNIDYKNRSIVFLTTKHHLFDLEKEDFNFLSSVGMAFRNGDAHV